MIYDDLKKICQHYGILKQLKKFAEETLGLQDSVIEMETMRSEGSIENIAEELADVMVLWEQIRLYYNIPTQTIQGIVTEKVNRQLKRMEEEKK